MDIDARIQRRNRRDEALRLVRDYEPLSPVTHVDEPAGRGPVFERLLDHLDPVFEGDLPPNGYLYGPFGAGKSAVVTALFRHLEQFAAKARSMIHTSTRQESPELPYFVTVDLREAAGPFSFYHAVLDALTEETIPQHGIGTDELRRRLRNRLAAAPRGAVVLVDHVGEPNTIGDDPLVDLFAGLPSSVTWLAVGRNPPEETDLTAFTGTTIEVHPYQEQMLIDVLMTRASEGLTEGRLAYERARQIAEWAGGNAHDALTVLFVAADRATRDERRRITEEDVATALGEIPSPSVSLGRVLTLPANKQAVLRELVDLPSTERESVQTTTKAISESPQIDLSQGTVKRFLYELAEHGTLGRSQADEQNRKGRPPSRVDIQFPATAFRRLYDLRQADERS